MRPFAVLVCLAACSTSDPRPDPLPALPPPAPAMTDRFTDAESCAQCHLVPDAAVPLHDAAGHNVSPVLLWRSSMMALAARDPFYLAVFAEERARAPDRRGEIDALCVRCHAPAGAVESDDALGFDDLVSATTVPAALGRGGVTCTLCHQIGAADLGDDRSFNGRFSVGYERRIYGRYSQPETGPMTLIVNYTPTLGAHIAQSELCATCHTVILPGAGGEVVEQATYLEWRSSRFATTQTCQSCHVSTVDEAGQAIVTPIASYPAGLAVRSPFGRHDLVGGNAYMLSLLATATEWLGAGITSDELAASAARSTAHLATAATLTVDDLTADGFTVRVENQTGHKLPTGYPSRRMWLHVRIEAAGATVFESGRVDARGAITGGEGSPPHRDEIAEPGQVQIWEARLVDASGADTHRVLNAQRYGKDDRILPQGFAPAGSDRLRTLPVGVIGDLNFAPGSDDVRYRVAVPAGATIHVELLYQAVRPEIIDAIDDTPTPAATRFVDLARSQPNAPIVMARTTRSR